MSETAVPASEEALAAELEEEQKEVDLSASLEAAEAKAAEDGVLLDNDLVKITLQGKIEESNYIGYSALVENKSNQYILIGIDQSSVDGLMTYIHVQGGSVAPGKKSKAEFRIYTEDSDIKTLDDLKNVEGVFTIATNTDGGNSYTQLKDTYLFHISDGSAETEAAAGGTTVDANEETPFDETGIYQTIVETMDESYEDTPHTVSYDREKKALNIYFQVGDGDLRTALATRHAQILEPWQQLTDGMVSVCGMAFMLASNNGASSVNMYVVDKFVDGNQYTEDDYLLWIENGVERYNYAK